MVNLKTPTNWPTAKIHIYDVNQVEVHVLFSSKHNRRPINIILVKVFNQQGRYVTINSRRREVW